MPLLSFQQSLQRAREASKARFEAANKSCNSANTSTHSNINTSTPCSITFEADGRETQADPAKPLDESSKRVLSSPLLSPAATTATWATSPRPAPAVGEAATDSVSTAIALSRGAAPAVSQESAAAAPRDHAQTELELRARDATIREQRSIIALLQDRVTALHELTQSQRSVSSRPTLTSAADKFGMTTAEDARRLELSQDIARGRLQELETQLRQSRDMNDSLLARQRGEAAIDCVRDGCRRHCCWLYTHIELLYYYDHIMIIINVFTIFTHLDHDPVRARGGDAVPPGSKRCTQLP
jgi:hypothetical protein